MNIGIAIAFRRLDSYHDIVIPLNFVNKHCVGTDADAALPFLAYEAVFEAFGHALLPHTRPVHGGGRQRWLGRSESADLRILYIEAEAFPSDRCFAVEASASNVDPFLLHLHL